MVMIMDNTDILQIITIILLKMKTYLGTIIFKTNQYVTFCDFIIHKLQDKILWKMTMY